MKNYLDKDQLIGCLWLIKSFTNLLVSDFEKVLSINYHNVFLFKIDEAYMHAIIINLGKIFSHSKKCEPFRLKKLWNISNKNLKSKIDLIEKNHQHTIEKIITNRNQLVAHLDKNYFNLCFSDNEISRMIRDMEIGMRISHQEAENALTNLPRSKGKSKERYTPNDLRDDLPEIKNILNEIESVIKQALNDHHKTKK